jgi:hypothetical protein
MNENQIKEFLKLARKNNIPIEVITKPDSQGGIIRLGHYMIFYTPHISVDDIKEHVTNQNITFVEDCARFVRMDNSYDMIRKKAYVYPAINIYFSYRYEEDFVDIFQVEDGFNTYRHLFVQFIPLLMVSYDEIKSSIDNPLYVGDNMGNELLIAPCYPPDIEFEKHLNIDSFGEVVAP